MKERLSPIISQDEINILAGLDYTQGISMVGQGLDEIDFDFS